MIFKNKKIIFDVKLLKEILVFFDIDKNIFNQHKNKVISEGSLRRLFAKKQISVSTKQIINYSRKNDEYQYFKNLIVNCNRLNDVRDSEIDKLFGKAKRENQKKNKITKKNKFRELDRKTSTPKIYNNNSSFVSNTEPSGKFVKKKNTSVLACKENNEKKKNKKTIKLELEDSLNKSEIKEVIKNRIEVLKQQYIDKKNNIDFENNKREKEVRERFAKRYKAVEGLGQDLNDFLTKERKKENELKKEIKKTLIEEKKKIEKEHKRVYYKNITEKLKLKKDFDSKVEKLYETLSDVKHEQFLEEKYKSSILMLEASKIKDNKNVLDTVECELDTTLPEMELDFETQELEFASCKNVIKRLSDDKSLFEKEYQEIKRKKAKNVKERIVLFGSNEKMRNIKKIKTRELRNIKSEYQNEVETIVKDNRNNSKITSDHITNLIVESDKYIENIITEQKDEIDRISKLDLSNQKKNQLIQNCEQKLRLNVHVEKAKLKNKIDYYKIQNMN